MSVGDMLKKMIGRMFGFDEQIKSLHQTIHRLDQTVCEIRSDRIWYAKKLDILEKEIQKQKESVTSENSLDELTQVMLSKYPLFDFNATDSANKTHKTIFDGKSDSAVKAMKSDLALVSTNNTFRMLCSNLINRWGNTAVKGDPILNPQSYYVLRGYILGVQLLVETIERAKKEFELSNKLANSSKTEEETANLGFDVSGVEEVDIDELLEK